MKILLFILCASTFALSASVDLCVSFDECDSCFSVYILKVNSFDKPQWNFKDSVECECGFWLSPFYEIPDLPEQGLFGQGGACIETRIGNQSGIVKGVKSIRMPSIPEIKVQKGELIGPAYYLGNKEDISYKFNQKIDVLWKTRFICQGNRSNDTTLAYKIKANLVGECPK